MKKALKDLVRSRLDSKTPTKQYRSCLPKLGQLGQAEEACLVLRDKEESVYFVRCGEFVKIGYTRGVPESKMTEFKVGSPYDYEMLASVPGGLRLQRKLHRIFKEVHHRGEWFRMEGALVEFIGSIKGVRFSRNWADDAGRSPLEMAAAELERINLLRVV